AAGLGRANVGGEPGGAGQRRTCEVSGGGRGSGGWSRAARPKATKLATTAALAALVASKLGLNDYLATVPNRT
ncbi:MAG TPA: hypothetical protein VFU85_00445, partial [Nocardioides sp.]|nr:hypothetical protein [Nocardioides sp.]